MRILACVTVACALALPATVARADIYAFTDDTGTTHFSNVPVDDRYKLVLEGREEAAPPAAGPGPAVSQALLARSAAYDPYVEAAARKVEVDEALIRAVIVVESAFNARAVSPRGAMGLMQLMPATAQQYGVSDAFDPEQNIKGGSRYLRDLIDRYDEDLELVLAAYNAGEGAVARHGNQVPPYKETRQYVPKVLRVYRALREMGQRT